MSTLQPKQIFPPMARCTHPIPQVTLSPNTNGLFADKTISIFPPMAGETTHLVSQI